MQDNTEQLLDYVHGRLDEDASAEVEELLKRTPTMQADLAVIRAVQTEMAVDAPDQAERRSAWTKLSASIDAELRRTPANENRQFSLMQVAVVATLAVFCTQLLTAPLWINGDPPGLVPASATLDAPTLQVAFRQDVPLGDITPLLRDLDATIIDGPSAMGLLTLQFGDDATRNAALVSLRERTDVVEIVSQP